MKKLRLTGGEPLVRKNIMHLVRQLSRHLESGALEELTLTTNGSQLARFAAELADCGVKRINVSLDTLDADKFRAITRWGDLDKVMAGIDAAQAAGLKVKLNAVALKGFNDAELPEMMRWAHGRGMDLTVIETMPMGEIDADRTDQYLPLSLLRANLERSFTLTRHPLQDRRPGPLCRGGRDRRPARLHHADDPQFLRKLQSRAADLHRHALYVPRPGRCRRPARAAARVRRQRAAVQRHRRGDRPQAEGPRLHHRPPHQAPGRRRAT